jgi:hypothetical protein
MRKGIIIAAGLLVLAAPASAAATPAKLSRADATASARATAAQVERGLEQFGYHAVSATVDPSRRSDAHRFVTVVGVTAIATRDGARDGSCMFAVYTRQMSAGRIVSHSSSLSCTPLFQADRQR